MTRRRKLRNTGGSVAGSASLTITWTLPTTDTQGAVIGTITAQTVYYDTVSRMGTGAAYANSRAVGDGVSTSKVITNLAPATTYYFAITTTVSGVESEPGVEVSGTTA